MKSTSSIALALAALLTSTTVLAQNRATPTPPQRPGLAVQQPETIGNAACIIKGAHVTEQAIVLFCFSPNGAMFSPQDSVNHFAAVFTPEEGSATAAMLGAILTPGMTQQGFPESVSFHVVLRPATNETREECAIVMGPGNARSTYRECVRAIAIGRGVSG